MSPANDKSDETRRAVLVASLTSPPARSPEDAAGGTRTDLAALPPEVEVLEVRADLVGDLDPAELRDRFAGRLLYTLRSRAEGGRFGGGEEERRERIATAAEGYDLVDLEAERDLAPELLAGISPERRVVSWHGSPRSLAGLEALFERMSRTPARIYKLVVFAEQSGDELAPLQLLGSLGRDDVVAFAAGPTATWTRLVAPRTGAAVVYGSAGEDPAAPGQPTVARLVEDYGLPELPPARALFGIVGHPVAHSLSPRLHNGAYRALGLPFLYVPFEAPVFGDFWLEVVESPVLADLGLPLAGLSVTTPFKETVLAVCGASSPLTERVAAANTLVLHEGVWEAETTDPEGVVLPLAARGIDLEGLPVAVVGCGGAGRAAAVGLVQRGADVTLVNRSRERGKACADLLRLPLLLLADVGRDGTPWDTWKVVVQATPLGRSDEDPLPFPVEELADGTTVVELVYRGLEGPSTRLVETIRRQGPERRLDAVDGREVLLAQAFEQFRLMTGRELPADLGRRLLGLEPPAAEAAGSAAGPSAAPAAGETVA